MPQSIEVSAPENSTINDVFLGEITHGVASPFEATSIWHDLDSYYEDEGLGEIAVALGINDNDGLILSKSSLSLDEGAGDSYTVQLAARPSVTVTVSLAARPRSTIGSITLSEDSLTFSSKQLEHTAAGDGYRGRGRR